MKTGIVTFVLLFALAGSIYGQVSFDDFYNNWKITQEKLKADLKDKKLIENNAKGLNIISHEDDLKNMKVRVDYVFNKDGLVTGKTIGILADEKDYKPLFDIFKSDAVKRCGAKYIQKVRDGKNLLIWQPDDNTRVFMSYAGLMVQYTILKNRKPKGGN